MQNKRRSSCFPHLLRALAILLFTAAAAHAGSHTWDIVEVFSDADGTVQFIELQEPNGATSENGIGLMAITTDANSYPMNAGFMPGSTAFKSFLIATPDFAALPGAPTPDVVLPPLMLPFFFSTSGDTIVYGPNYDIFTFTGGELPTDGVTSLNRDGSTGINSPTNYNGDTGSIDVGLPPVPATSTWGLIGLALTLLVAGSMALRRADRRATLSPD